MKVTDRSAAKRRRDGKCATCKREAPIAGCEKDRCPNVRIRILLTDSLLCSACVYARSTLLSKLTL